MYFDFSNLVCCKIQYCKKFYLDIFLSENLEELRSQNHKVIAAPSMRQNVNKCARSFTCLLGLITNQNKQIQFSVYSKIQKSKIFEVYVCVCANFGKKKTFTFSGLTTWAPVFC